MLHPLTGSNAQAQAKLAATSPNLSRTPHLGLAIGVSCQLLEAESAQALAQGDLAGQARHDILDYFCHGLARDTDCDTNM
jgi:hypothetical protein